MSLTYALAAAINGPTGPRATLSHGLSRTKPRRRRSGPRDSHPSEVAGRPARHAVAQTASLLASTNQLGQAGTTSPAASSNAGQPAAKSPNRGGAHPKAGGQASNPRLRSASISPEQHSGLDWLVLALLTAVALAALWFIVAGRGPHSEALAAGSPGPRPLHRAAEVVAGAVATRQLLQGARALAGAVGLVALSDAAAHRRRRRATTGSSTLPRRGHQPAEAATPAPSDLNEETAATVGLAAFELGNAAAQNDDLGEAEAAYRRADELGHPAAASNLGVLLEQHGDLAGAEAAYRRADQRGGPTGAFNLGALLADSGDLAAAEAAYRRGDRRGDAESAFSVGGLLAGRNDLAVAEAAYRDADGRGRAGGASNLGVLLEHRGDLAGAEDAYRRADDRGDAAGAFRLGGLLAERNDLAAAEDAYRRADETGHPSAASNLGVLLEQRGDLAGAEAAYRRADRRGRRRRRVQSRRTAR